MNDLPSGRATRAGIANELAIGILYLFPSPYIIRLHTQQKQRWVGGDNSLFIIFFYYELLIDYINQPLQSVLV